MSKEEMKALVEMNNMLKAENTKLKQEKEELIEWLKWQVSRGDVKTSQVLQMVWVQ